jgi:hypothetical protein
MVACHRRIERFLAVLVDFAIRLDGKMLTESETVAMEAALRYFRDATPHHAADEERGLFPAMQQACPTAVRNLPDLERDHRGAERLHSIVNRLGIRWMQQGTLEQWKVQELQSALADLSALYREHI